MGGPSAAGVIVNAAKIVLIRINTLLSPRNLPGHILCSYVEKISSKLKSSQVIKVAQKGKEHVGVGEGCLLCGVVKACSSLPVVKTKVKSA